MKEKNGKLDPVAVSTLVSSILRYLQDGYSEYNYDERIAALKSAANVLENVTIQAQLVALAAHNLEKYTR